MAHAVALPTQEIGVRLALGASPGNVRRMIVGAGLRTAGIGLAIGLVASFGVGRLLTSLLYGVSPSDPASLLATAAILLATALLASGVAALRAGRIDPLRALRYE
jgi:ABC-type antimicrobial peptide transport system permease subunit